MNGSAVWKRVLGGVLGFAVIGLAVTILQSNRSHAESAAASSAVYWTCEPLEPDSLASAWLIRTFVAPGCEIRVLPKGQTLATGIPFDLPLVDLTRDRARSTFRVIYESSHLSDAGLASLAAQVDHLELRSWNDPQRGAPSELESRLRAALEADSNPEHQLVAGAAILSDLYARPKSDPRSPQ